MVVEQHRISSKSTRAPQAPPFNLINANRIKADDTQRHFSLAFVKDLRGLNLLNEFFPIADENIRVQETVELIPHPDSFERIFYSYIDDRTETRSRTDIRFNQKFSNYVEQYELDSEIQLNFHSSTLFIFPKRRAEKFISEIRYYPEHVTIKYKTNFEVLARGFAPLIEHFYENIPQCYERMKEIFYRI